MNGVGTRSRRPDTKLKIGPSTTRRCADAVWGTPEAIATWMPVATERQGRSRKYSDIAIEAGLMLEGFTA
jgi:hypothetical protein